MMCLSESHFPITRSFLSFVLSLISGSHVSSGGGVSGLEMTNGTTEAVLYLYFFLGGLLTDSSLQLVHDVPPWHLEVQNTFFCRQVQCDVLHPTRQLHLLLLKSLLGLLREVASGSDNTGAVFQPFTSNLSFPS